MTPVDTDGAHLIEWVAVTGRTLARLPAQSAPLRLAHASSGFLAIGRAGLLLRANATARDHCRAHDLVFEITADAERWLAEVIGDSVPAEYTDRGARPRQFADPPGLSVAAQLRLQRAAHHTAGITRDLLTGVAADPDAPSPLRGLAEDLANGAAIIADLYDEHADVTRLHKVANKAVEQFVSWRTAIRDAKAADGLDFSAPG